MQTDRQTDRQRARQAGRQVVKSASQTDIQGETNSQRDGQTFIDRHSHRQKVCKMPYGLGCPGTGFLAISSKFFVVYLLAYA